MKRFLFLLTLTVAVLVLCLSLSACGEETLATTKKSAVTSIPTALPETTPVQSTSVVTTPATTAPATTPDTTALDTTTTPDTSSLFVPEMPDAVGISYSYFFSGFLVAELDENGLTLKRELYKPATMQRPDSYLGFYYEYDENGKLVKYIADIYGDKTVGTVSWDTDGQTAIVTDTETGEEIRRILFEIDGKMVSERWFSEGAEVFYFEYDETGRMITEMIPGEMELLVFTTYEGNEATLLFEVMYNKVAHWLITYNEAGYPMTLENKIEGAQAYYSYEYDAYNRCQSSSAAVDGYEDIYYFIYDGEGRLGTIELEDENGMEVTVYTYNEADQKISKTVTQTAKSGEVSGCTVTEYEYAADGSLAKETVSHYNASGTLVEKEEIDHTA